MATMTWPRKSASLGTVGELVQAPQKRSFSLANRAACLAFSSAIGIKRSNAPLAYGLSQKASAPSSQRPSLHLLSVASPTKEDHWNALERFARSRRINCRPSTHLLPVPKDSRTQGASRLIITVASSINAIESTLIIVVDDDASVANSTCRLIRSLGMQAEAFYSGTDLLNSGRATEASCVILDVRMPDLNGLQLQRRLKEIRSSIPMIFFSAHAGKEEEDQALRSGAVAFLRKPVHRHDLLRVIRMALERKS